MGGTSFNNSLANRKGTPGAITDLTANKPATAPEGTLFFSTDDNTIEQFQNGGWVSKGDGGDGGSIVTGTFD